MLDKTLKLIADNDTLTDPILLARDNGTTRFAVNDPVANHLVEITGGTTGDGNADIYLGSASSGVDRHWNVAGMRFWALRMGRELKARLGA